MCERNEVKLDFNSSHVNLIVKGLLKNVKNKKQKKELTLILNGRVKSAANVEEWTKSTLEIPSDVTGIVFGKRRKRINDLRER